MIQRIRDLMRIKEVIDEINKKVGMRLITKAGEKGVMNLWKLIPLGGGVVGGAFDATWCRTTGKVAKRLFRQSKK